MTENSNKIPKSNVSCEKDQELKELMKEIHADFGDTKLNPENGEIDNASKDGGQGRKRMESRDVALYSYEYDSLSDEDAIEYKETFTEADFPISFKRGKSGVYDIDELVYLLSEENGTDICVIKIPEEINYADYLLLVTGRSSRHLLAMAEITKWTYKRKRGTSDPQSVKIEGQGSDHSWLSVDLGNIILHLLRQSTREKYDLETLWSVGAAFDDQLKQEDDLYSASSLDDLFKHTDGVEYSKTDNLDETVMVTSKYMDSPGTVTQEQDGLESVAGWHSLSSKESK